jgi:hypothetical protein
VGGPIFLIGAMGSGTTLLRLMLDSHEHIAIPPETGFMRAYKAHRFIPFKWSGWNWAVRMGWTREELDVELRGFYDRLFSRYAEQQGKRRWGEKTPLHVWHMSAMARLFPDAVFLCIVRHPGATVASNMKRWHYTLIGGAYHFERTNHEIARQAAQLGPRAALLRYEELVLQPEAVMREVLEWLGEPWSPGVLEHHRVQAGRGGKLVVEGRNRVDDPIDVSRISRWFDVIGAQDRETLHKRLGRYAELFGYDARDPAVLEPLNARGAYLTAGAEIDARIADFEDLDLRTQPPVPRADRLYHPRELTLAYRQPGPVRAPGRARKALRPLVRVQPRAVRRLARRVSRALRR